MEDITMPAPIALQLYTLRDAMKADFAETVRKVAAMGFVGVETAGFPGTTPQAAGELFKELGLEVPSAHIKMPLGDDKQEVLDTMAALGARHIVCPGVGREPYETIDGIKRVCERFNEANAVAQANGYTFSIHNHWMEFQEVEGRNASEVLLENLDPTVLFQVDTYWVKAAGLDPVAVVQQLGKRAPLLHIKDGPATIGESMLPLGEGSMDIKALVKAGAGNTEWLIVELDRCDSDMVEAVQKSYKYMVGEGLARGNQN
jgi:sugar phosphate isomerase/epimerase